MTRGDPARRWTASLAFFPAWLRTPITAGFLPQIIPGLIWSLKKDRKDRDGEEYQRTHGIAWIRAI